MPASDSLSSALASLKSLCKLLLQSRRSRIDRSERPGPLVIMANGPSLRQAIDTSLQKLQAATTMAVNFAANAPDFKLLQPDFYVLADPHFFSSSPDANLTALRSNLAAVDWPMTLFVPVSQAKNLPKELTANDFITINTYNLVGIEGWNWFKRMAYSHGWGMPRPRNVLVPAIACGILAGFRKIYILGADHSWIKNLEVDEQNRVISVQPHFYKESAAEQRRVDAVYADVRLHQVVESFAVALKSYHALQHWAESQGVEIFNSTPGSFIDAFPRSPLP